MRWKSSVLPMLVAIVCLATPAIAAPVPIESVVTTFHGGTEEELREAIDGADVGRNGWYVAPLTDRPQAAVFRTSSPVEAATMDITLCFLSGRPDSFCSEFTVSVTSDPQPSLASQWNVLKPLRFEATGPALKMDENGHLVAEGAAADAVFQLAVNGGSTPITGFRLDVFPRRTVRGRDGPQLARARDGDFVLTEFRVDAATPRTTNVARGRPVKASHPLWGKFTPEALTDGLPGTFAHPLEPDLGSKFHFEIDLGSVRRLDHIALRNRGDGTVPERLSRVTVELYVEPPDSGAAPAWTGRYRADGTHPGVGELDVIRANNGSGTFAGRWLRLSSDSPVAFSPQFAEVEVYEELTLQIAAVRADGVALPTRGSLQIPPGARWLAVAMKLAHGGLPEEIPCRWRLRGFHADWQSAPELLAEGACPPPGRYVFEAQVRHTDGEWDAAVLAVPVEVRGYFWQARGFWIACGAAAALAGLWIVRRVTRQRLARGMAVLEAKATLDEERARIARDMHDEVGARLSQLAILQDIFAREHSLPEGAQKNMQQLAESTRQAVASLDEVVWAVNPKNDTLPSLAGYLEQCATGYLGAVEIACRLDAPFDWPPIEIRAQVRHNLVLAFREALQNVLKHADATEVTLTLRLDGSDFIVTLADNGRGLPDELGGAGKDGLENMSARLVAIGGHCEVRRRAAGGTEVEMRVHLAHDATASPP
jgi:signal transduction histidine kinase